MDSRVRKVMFGAVIAAAYAALTFLFLPISFGMFQFRVSEILTILPYFFPVAVPGLFVGCIIANLISPYGFADMLIGSVATLIAASITMQIGKYGHSESVARKALACLPPVFINALFIGAMIASWMVSAGEVSTFFAAFSLYFVQVAFGQAAVLYLLGLPLMIYLPRMGVIDRLKQVYSGVENDGEDEN